LLGWGESDLAGGVNLGDGQEGSQETKEGKSEAGLKAQPNWPIRRGEYGLTPLNIRIS
jgi:hypothetical protein